MIGEPVLKAYGDENLAKTNDPVVPIPAGQRMNQSGSFYIATDVVLTNFYPSGSTATTNNNWIVIWAEFKNSGNQQYYLVQRVPAMNLSNGWRVAAAP